jgi:hypothetical protein
MNLLKFSRAVLAALLCASFAFAANAPAASFKDSFEGHKLYPFWAVQQQSGTVSLTKEEAYSGSQSIKFTPLPGGSRNVALFHNLGARTKGEVFVAFFDTAPSQPLSAKLHVSDSTNPDIDAAVGIQESGSDCYVAEFGGAGAGCSPGVENLIGAVRRSNGWHVFTIQFGPASVSISIDGETVRSIAGDFAFDGFRIEMTGTVWDPGTAAYFDDFSLVPAPAPGSVIVPGIELTTGVSDARTNLESTHPESTAAREPSWPTAASQAVAAAAASGTSFVTVGRRYTGVVDLSCPAGYVAVVATCNQDVSTVIHDRSIAPVIGSWVFYLTPNASAATGVHCDLVSPFSSSTAFIRCVK